IHENELSPEVFHFIENGPTALPRQISLHRTNQITRMTTKARMSTINHDTSSLRRCLTLMKCCCSVKVSTRLFFPQRSLLSVKSEGREKALGVSLITIGP